MSCCLSLRSRLLAAARSLAIADARTCATVSILSKCASRAGERALLLGARASVAAVARSASALSVETGDRPLRLDRVLAPRRAPCSIACFLEGEGERPRDNLSLSLLESGPRAALLDRTECLVELAKRTCG